MEWRELQASDMRFYFFALTALRGFAAALRPRVAVLLALRAPAAFFAGRPPWFRPGPERAASALIWAMVALPVFNAFEAIREILSVVCLASLTPWNWVDRAQCNTSEVETDSDVATIDSQELLALILSWRVAASRSPFAP